MKTRSKSCIVGTLTIFLCLSVSGQGTKRRILNIAENEGSATEFSRTGGHYNWLRNFATLPSKNTTDASNLSEGPHKSNMEMKETATEDSETPTVERSSSAITERKKKEHFRTSPVSSSTSKQINGLPAVSETFGQYVDKIKAVIDELMAIILPKLLDILGDIDISGDCLKSAMSLFMGFRDLKDWAVSMVDALGKPPAGIARGTGTAMGDFDQCINIVAKEAGYKEEIREIFRGKYCLVRLTPPELFSFYPEHWEKEYKRTILPEIIKTDTIFNSFVEYFPRFGNTSHFKFGLCIPSTCTGQDILNILSVFAAFVETTVQIEHCNVKEVSTWRAEQIVICAFLSLLILFILMSSLVEIFIVTNQQPVTESLSGKITSTLAKFSAIRSSKRLADTETADDNLGFIRGLRLISIIWMVVAHVFYFPELDYYYQLQSVLTLVELNKISIFQMMSNSSFSVDTFFVVSAILTAYKIGQRKAQGRSAGYFRFLLRRIFRVLPAELFIIAIFLLLPLCGDGPLWNNLVSKGVDKCRDTWWRNLLFIQNLWWDNNQCLFHLWFLSCLVQYSLISIPLLALLLKRPMKGIVVCSCLMVAAAIAIGVTTHHNRFGPGISATNFYYTYMWKQIFKNYMSPWAHLGPYCVGLVIGVVLVKYPKLRFKSWQLVVGWCSSIAIGAAVVCGLYNFVYPPKTYIMVSAVYNSLSRNVWAIALAWLCIICGRGQGGLVDRMLAWKVLIPFDRLGYFMYLTHLPIMYYFRGRARALSFAGLPDMTVTALGLLLVTILVSYICYVLVEAPVQVILDSMLFPDRKKHRDSCDYSTEKIEPVTVLEITKLDENFRLANKGKEGNADRASEDITNAGSNGQVPSKM